MCGIIIAQRIRYAPSSVAGTGGQRRRTASPRGSVRHSSGVSAAISASSGVLNAKRTT